MTKDISIFITVNSCRDWKAPFAMSVTALLNQLYQKQLGGRLKRVDIRAGAGSSLLPSGRQAALKIACEGNFTHWLSVDDDMAFPADTIEQLIKHDKDVVCANYRRKIIDDVKGVCLALDGTILDSTDQTGLEQVLAMGMGVSLMKLEKIRPIPAPHFEVIWNPTANDYWGEDYYFSNRLEKHGIDIYCDHDLSQQVYHWGDFPYAWQQKPKEQKENAA